jgi:hypothetical protein
MLVTSGFEPFERAAETTLKKPLDPGIGSTLYNPWSNWHEF